MQRGTAHLRREPSAAEDESASVLPGSALRARSAVLTLNRVIKLEEAGMGSVLELESLGNKPFDGFLLSAHRRQTGLCWCVGTLQNAALRGKTTHI